jgi:hypothetical protein
MRSARSARPLVAVAATAAMSVLLLLLVALCASPVAAAVTENSVLACATADAVPGANITCNIYLRDELEEPVSAASVSTRLFSIRVLTEVTLATVTVSAVTATIDPSIVQFTVSSDMGTRLRVDAYVSQTGLHLRNTGVVVLVLEVPPTRLGAITCDCGAQLAFRASTRCTVPLLGANGLPALATTRDFFLTEEHGDGSFRFVSGARQLVFQYTAPTFPSMSYAQLLFRLGLLSDAATVIQPEAALALTVVYPALAPTSRSRLRCGSSDGDAAAARRCFVSASDNLGPVAFVAAGFTIAVQRILAPADGGGTVDAPEVAFAWAPAGNAGVSLLTFSLSTNTRVFSGVVNVVAVADRKPIAGSPYTMAFGIAPQPSDLRLVKCSREFAIAGRSINCFIAVAASVTPDPAYVVPQALVGAFTAVYLNNDTAATNADPLLVGLTLIVAVYVPPADLPRRVQDLITVTSAGVAVSGSPFVVSLYPATAAQQAPDTRVGAAVAGVLLFGAVIALGMFFSVRNARIRQRMLQRLVEHQRAAAASMPSRPLFRAFGSGAGGVAVPAVPHASPH